MILQRRIIITEDGSQSVFDEKTGESFHSHFGAISESQHIFIDAGLRFASENKSELSILEIGFGTGLNALLTAVYCDKEEKIVTFSALEAYPLSTEILDNIQYHRLIENVNAKLYFRLLHSAGNTPVSISKNFLFALTNSRLEEWNGSKNEFDLVYFDAFSPEAQPELWTGEIFEKMFNCLKPGGILVTYSCKGIVKRAMKSAGFLIQKLPGPKGKREILRAIKPKK